MVVCIVLLCCGCGSVPGYGDVGNALETDHRPRMTRGALVTAANSICANRTTALGQLSRPRGPAQSREFFARVATIERDEARSLSTLRPPLALERDYASLLAASAELARVAERFHTAVVRDDDHERRRALSDADRVSEAYDRAARRLGLACRQTL